MKKDMFAFEISMNHVIFVKVTKNRCLKKSTFDHTAFLILNTPTVTSYNTYAMPCTVCLAISITLSSLNFLLRT